MIMVCAACLMVACSQKQSVVEVPVSHIDIEQLNQDIDYSMDISGLNLSDLRILRNAPAARQGYPFRDAYLRSMFGTTTWYDSLTWSFYERMDFDKVQQKDNESWRDYYYRAIDVSKAVSYTAEEQAFMKRLKEREDELAKQNFDVGEGLRVNMQNLLNPNQLQTFDSLLCQQLAQNGFAIVPGGQEQLFHVYEQNDYSQFPAFVTTDLYLQLFHLYIDCMLRELEEHRLSGLMTTLSKQLYDAMHRQSVNAGSEDIRRYAHHNAIFFAVGYQLLTGRQIATGDEVAMTQEEVDKVMASQNAPSRFMADYREVEFPYSLFRPRGHYTRSDVLQRYFRGMMWLQSVPFGMDHDDELCEAIVMADALQDNKEAARCYETVNTLVGYLMGQPDNLSIPQVQAEMKKKGLLLAELLESAKDLADVKAALKETGDKQTRIRPKFERTSHNKICLMPQRYQPDAEVLQEMVDYDNTPTQRGTPKGLDFMAAMGVSAAEQLLTDEQQSWKGFKPMLGKMKQRMGEIDWRETLCTQWMNALKVIGDKEGKDKMPYFMVTPEWDLKNLNAMLASWAELKHDAILYAKQPMGAECGGGEDLPDPVVKGYVEPNIGFWEKAIELLDNTYNLLKQQGMLTKKVETSTQRMREEVEFLLRVSEKEVQGKTVTEEEYDQLKCIGAVFENISLDLLRQEDQYLAGWDDIEGADRKVALIADVYTANADNNPNHTILYVGVGLADEIYVVVEIDGSLYLTRGAVLSYRELQCPIDQQRLTDEEWQQNLESDPREGVPQWMERIIVPTDKKPVSNEKIFYSSGC